MKQRSALSDLKIRASQNVGLLTAIALFAVFYVFYNINHPRGFSAAVLIQNSNEVYALAMVAMAQTVPVLLGGLDLSVGAVMTLVNTLASSSLRPKHSRIISLKSGSEKCLILSSVLTNFLTASTQYHKFMPSPAQYS